MHLKISEKKIVSDFLEEEQLWRWSPHYGLIRDIREGRGCPTMALLWEANILKDWILTHDNRGENLKTVSVKGAEEHGSLVLTGRSEKWECDLSYSGRN